MMDAILIKVAMINAVISAAEDFINDIVKIVKVAECVAKAIGFVSMCGIILFIAVGVAEAIDPVAVHAVFVAIGPIDVDRTMKMVFAAIFPITLNFIKQSELQTLSPKDDVTTLKRQQLQQYDKTDQKSLMRKEQQLQPDTTEIERLKTEHRRETKRLENELTREKQAKGNAFELCRRLEEETIHLKCQAEDDKRENNRLKQQIASMSTDVSNAYDMSRDPRGVCVIINNIHFEDMAERGGAEGDTGRLGEVFESIGFMVVTFSDLDHAKMVATMKDQGKADHSNYDCFVCVIMSHGTMGKVYSSDDVGIDICELMKPVNAKKCPSLKGKPKLFFIQACQGEKTQRKEGFDGEYDAKPVPFICHEADFFLGLATVPGYVAKRYTLRDTEQDPEKVGAPYVHHLAKLLKDFGPTHDLSAIMAMVCDKMNDINDDKCGWISSNHSTLRKKVVFNTK